MLNNLLIALSAFEAGSAPLADALWRATWQGGLAVLLVGLLTHCWRTMPPLLRVWLWRLAFVKVVLALVWSGAVTVPAPEVPVVRHMRLPVVAMAVPQAKMPVAASPKTAPIAEPTPMTAQPVEPASSAKQRVDWQMLETMAQNLPWRSALLLVWALGVMWGCGSLAVAWRQTRGLRRNSRALEDVAVRMELKNLAESMRVHPVPEVRASVGSGPLVLGLWRPGIILPGSAMEAPPRTRRMMLAHELAHIRHGDLLWGWLAAMAEIALFFHPLVRWAAHEWRLAQEIACDARALRATGELEDAYGAMLVEAAIQAKAQAQPVLVAMGVSETFTNISRRLRAMAERSRLTGRQIAVIGGLIGMLAVLVCVPWRLAAQPIAVEHNNSTAGHNIITLELARGVEIDLDYTAGSMNYYQNNADGTRELVGVVDILNVPRKMEERRMRPEDIPVNAVLMGDPAVLRAMLQHQPPLLDMKAPEMKDAVARVVSAQHGDIGASYNSRRFDRGGTLEVLLEAGAAADAGITNGETPLQVAARRGDLATVRALVEHGAAVNAVNAKGETPTLQALTYGYDEVADYLRNHGGKAVVNGTPFFAAIGDQDIKTINRLLAASPRLANQPDRYDRTPLQLFARCGVAGYANACVSAGADLNAKAGMPALFWAARRGDDAVMRDLLEAGADPNIRADKHYVSLDRYPLKDGTVMLETLNRACNADMKQHRLKERKAIVELLLAHGAKVNDVDGEGITALHVAANTGLIDVVELLIQAGANVNAKSRGGEVPLDWALACGEDDCAKLLLKHGANAKDVALTDSIKESPETMQMLAEQGVEMPKDTYVAQMLVTPDNRWLAVSIQEQPSPFTSKKDCVAHYAVYDLKNGKSSQRLVVRECIAMIHAIAGDNRRIVVAGRHGSLERWDLVTGKLSPYHRLPVEEGTNSRLSADGSTYWTYRFTDYAVTDSQQVATILELHRLADGKLLRQLRLPGEYILRNRQDTVACGISGKYNRQTLQAIDAAYVVWDLRTGREINRIPIPRGYQASNTNISDDGRFVAAKYTSASRKAEEFKLVLNILDTKTGKIIASDEGLNGRFVFTPTGTGLVGQKLHSGDILEIDTATGKVRRTFPGVTGGEITFTPDGSQMLVATNDYTDTGLPYTHRKVGHVQIVDFSTGKMIRTISPKMPAIK